MEKTDFKKTLKSYQVKPHVFSSIEVPALQYCMIDGHGDPNTSHEFAAAVTALFSVSYTLKFASKKELGKDYVVMPLEGLWWSNDMRTFTSARDKAQWDWTMMIMQPEWITVELFTAAVAKVSQKNALPALKKLRLQTLREGLCIQTLHIGSYDDEAPVLAALHDDFIPSNGLQMTGKHHEIYLSDFRKVPPHKLKTILRQPVKKVM